jgi:organic hydroperoxide reductase OsmC/OhrA
MLCDLSHQGQLLAALIAACLATFLTEVTSEETTTENDMSSNTSWVNGGNETQNA